MKGMEILKKLQKKRTKIKIQVKEVISFTLPVDVLIKR